MCLEASARGGFPNKNQYLFADPSDYRVLRTCSRARQPHFTLYVLHDLPSHRFPPFPCFPPWHRGVTIKQGRHKRPHRPFVVAVANTVHRLNNVVGITHFQGCRSGGRPTPAKGVR